jgi:hypothetical protein
VEEIVSDIERNHILAEIERHGVDLDYVFLRFQQALPAQELHRAAALAGMAAISTHVAKYYRVTWDESKLTGMPVTFDTFWGTDDVSLKPIEQNAWSIPEIDGYKTAYFLPPHGLRTGHGNKPYFEHINALVLGPNPKECEIYSWGTDWSNYFDAGKEWWGAFYWTIHRPHSDIITVIGASTTD